MVNTCLVYGCSYRGSSGFYSVPQKNSYIQKLWLRCCGRPTDFQVKNHHRVCKNHFHQGAFNPKGHLHKGKLYCKNNIK